MAFFHLAGGRANGVFFFVPVISVMIFNPTAHGPFRPLTDEDFMGILQRPTFSDRCSSLLKTHLTEEVWQQIKGRKTTSGYTVERLIRSGVEQEDSAIGVYGGDAESYDLFAPLTDPIIADYHGNTGPHPASDFSTATLPELSSGAKKRVRSTRIRVGRNLAGFPLGPAMTGDQRRDVESLVSLALSHLSGPLEGTYHPLPKMDEATRKGLVARHLLFKSEDRFLTSAGLMGEWPDARGLFLSHDETFSVWINEEDQLRIIALQEGGEVTDVFTTLARGVAALSSHLHFLKDPRLGYLTSCPTNLGTAMRASVHMSLKGLSHDGEALKEMARELGLQVRGVHGEHSRSQGGVYDISNRMRLGVTEAAALSHLISGINRLAKLDDEALNR